jgi:RNA polymerase sigma factor (sigma-70 family)
MSRGATGDVVRQVARIYGEGTLTGLTDAQLLDRFRLRRDESAFEAIVARHGPMVLGVCRGVLRDSPEVDDAFQAAFLVLVKKAGAIRGRGGVGGWLYRVSYRIALRARSRSAGPEIVRIAPASATNDPEAEAIRAELRALVHRELDRLPEKYRAPVVLCDLEGLTHDEAAHRLSWPVGTVKGRLSRARDRLRERLRRRGVSEPAGVVTALVAAESSRAAPPAGLVRATVAAALAWPMSGAVPVAVTALMTGALRAMFWMKLSQAAAISAAVLAVSGGIVALRGADDRAGAPVVETRPDGDPPGKPRNDIEAIQGVWQLAERVVNGQVERFDLRLQPAEGMVFKGDVRYKSLLVVDEPPSLEKPLRFVLDPEQSPPTIDLLSGNQAVYLGIYQLDGDTLTLCTNTRGDEARPQSFGTKPGLPQLQTAWRRVRVRNEGPVVAKLADPPADQPIVTTAEAPPRRDRGTMRRNEPSEETPVEATPEVIATERAEIDVREIELAVEKNALQKTIEVLREKERNNWDRSLDVTDPERRDRLRAQREEEIDLLQARLAQDRRSYLEHARELEESKRQLALLEKQAAAIRAQSDAGSSRPPTAGPYRLQPGDVLRIEFLEALPGRPIMGERIVRPDGTINLGFYGDLPVAGLTAREIKEKAILHMRKYLNDEVLGLVDQDPETGKTRPVPPVESDRVLVDDSANFRDPSRLPTEPAPKNDSQRLDALERKLDLILQRLGPPREPIRPQR